MKLGTRVEVRNRFDARWSKGFEVAEIDDAADSGMVRLRLRRRTDNSILPVWFDPDEVREERKRETWWI